MKEPEKQNESCDALALARHAAVSWIQEAIGENFTLVRSLTLASQRSWGQKRYSTATLESWLYHFRKGGFQALRRKPRKDKGTRRALSPQATEALLELRRQHPQLKAKVPVRQLLEKGVLQPETFSMPSIYRLLAENGLDAQSLKNNASLLPDSNGPTKRFECAHPNELWMTDMMFGPTLRLSNGRLIQSRLFALLDDCSRLIPHAQYYDSEKLGSFLDCFAQGLARRGLPEKLYTDRGKIFTSYHLQVVCANLDVRLCHAKPYAPWSRGKIERWFRTLQQDFEARLAIDPVHDLQQLNERLWRWIEGEYHQRVHRSLEGQSPAQRFAQRALNLRLADSNTDWQRLFLCRAKRRVRLDATVSLEGTIWEVPVHLRGRLVQLRFDPFTWRRVEVWLNETYIGAAHRCDKQLNSKTYTDRDYERPDKS